MRQVVFTDVLIVPVLYRYLLQSPAYESTLGLNPALLKINHPSVQDLDQDWFVSPLDTVNKNPDPNTKKIEFFLHLVFE